MQSTRLQQFFHFANQTKLRTVSSCKQEFIHTQKFRPLKKDKSLEIKMNPYKTASGSSAISPILFFSTRYISPSCEALLVVTVVEEVTFSPSSLISFSVVVVVVVVFTSPSSTDLVVVWCSSCTTTVVFSLSSPPQVPLKVEKFRFFNDPFVTVTKITSFQASIMNFTLQQIDKYIKF